MLKTLWAVVAGYLAMFVCVFATFTGIYWLLGPEGSFQPGTYQVSGAWIGSSLPLSLLAAAVGGLVCAKLSPGRRGPVALVVVVLVLGALSAIPALMDAGQPPAPREGTVGNLQAMNEARQPVWIALLNPVLGAAGVLAGARLHRPAVE